MATPMGLGKQLLMFSLVTLMATVSHGQVPGAITKPGIPIDGLQISLTSNGAGHHREAYPRFRVELKNAGSHDLILNAGIMLANGRRQYADAITLLLRLPSGREQRWVLLGPVGIMGRMDPLVVPLPAGAAFSIPVNLANYAPFGKPPLKLEPGAYVLQALFHGKRGVDPNLDMQGMKLMPYWTGTVVSNRLQFEVAKP